MLNILLIIGAFAINPILGIIVLSFFYITG